VCPFNKYPFRRRLAPNRNQANYPQYINGAEANARFGNPFFEVKACEAVQMPGNARQALRATYFCRNVSVPQSQSNKEKAWMSLQFVPLGRNDDVD
jgi:hypothetical protein